MPAITDPNLGLNYGWTLGESGWGAGMNANLKRLGAVVSLSVKDRDLATPPASPVNGDRYLIPAGATGVWSGKPTKSPRGLPAHGSTTSPRSAGSASSRTRPRSRPTRPPAGVPASPSDRFPLNPENPPEWRFLHFWSLPMTDPQQPVLVDNMLLLRKEDFDDLLERAAERGAKRALADVGLDGDDAAHDIRELRGLLDAFNTAKHTAWQTVIKMVTTGFLLALVAGALIKFKVFGGGQ